MTSVILLAHGSPDARASAAAHGLAHSAQERIGLAVRAAFLQHDAATLSHVARQLAGEGERRVLVVPTLLSDAFHARIDVPAELAAAQRDTGLVLRRTPALGPDPSLLAAMDRELPSGPRVLAAAGTTDLLAQRRLTDLASRWARESGQQTAVAFAAQAEPDVATALADLEERAGVPAAVAAFVLFPGVLPDRIIAAADGRPVSAPLAQSLELVDLVARRVDATIRLAA